MSAEGEEPKIVIEIRHALIGLVIATVVLYAILLGISKYAIDTANQAENQANKAAFQTDLAHEKVCSLSNQEENCIALFERLARNITPEQRDRLACVVVKHLRGDTATNLLKDNPACERIP
jgi:hypothetical protein